MGYRDQIAKEAVFVGTATIPFYFVAQTLTNNLNLKLSATSKTAVSAVLTGVLFHLTSEAAGLNHWYLSNSGAAHKKRNKVRHLTNVASRSHCGSHRNVCALSIQLAEEGL